MIAFCVSVCVYVSVCVFLCVCEGGEVQVGEGGDEGRFLGSGGSSGW